MAAEGEAQIPWKVLSLVLEKSSGSSLLFCLANLGTMVKTRFCLQDQLLWGLSHSRDTVSVQVPASLPASADFPVLRGAGKAEKLSTKPQGLLRGFVLSTCREQKALLY